MIAETILKQLGGNRFIVMTGAKNFYTNGNDLCFKIGRNKTKANAVRIEYDYGMDLYKMEFIYATNDRLGKNYEFIKGQKKILKTYNDVYFDMLEELFTEYTGLYTRLF
jgi:hypothetical protein